MEQKPAFVNNIWLSDDAHCHLSEYVWAVHEILGISAQNLFTL